MLRSAFSIWSPDATIARTASSLVLPSPRRLYWIVATSGTVFTSPKPSTMIRGCSGAAWAQAGWLGLRQRSHGEQQVTHGSFPSTHREPAERSSGRGNGNAGCPRAPSKLMPPPSGGGSFQPPRQPVLWRARTVPAEPEPERAFCHERPRRTPPPDGPRTAHCLTRSACEGPPRWRPRGRPNSKYQRDVQTHYGDHDIPTRDDFETLLNESLGGENETFEGKVVKGIVTAIENDLAVIDVGLKSRRPGRRCASSPRRARRPS